ncbi:hypothetical protein GW17_00030167 [Ensete ventricosum]|uniref:Uncharacterized protein n=1 Tax=Ensete ventricosum TaxID=4639 RepID=A0A426ZHG9_ENSVE|nr:hypothetical protein B296_00042714 [Ensete ventricosum]RWW06500.1 hypothetical protein GW17_00030167 [Ensete ventricosum]
MYILIPLESTKGFRFLYNSKKNWEEGQPGYSKKKIPCSCVPSPTFVFYLSRRITWMIPLIRFI